MKINDLETICIAGLGLLGGSVGLAVNRVFPNVHRVGYSHRRMTRELALEAGVVDEIREIPADAAAGAQLVVLAGPIGVFEQLMQDMAGGLGAGCVVTDVGSTKVLVTRWARRHLPPTVHFVGSHPMAGSEQRGVEFARADLFDDAACIVTATAGTHRSSANLVESLWRELGMRVSRMSPTVHDRVLGRISHLPHILAGALVNISDPEEMLLCGKGFLDSTRIASGPAGVWHDILMTNAANSDAALGRLIEELQSVRQALRSQDGEKVTRFLDRARTKRNDLVERKLQRKELPS